MSNELETKTTAYCKLCGSLVKNRLWSRQKKDDHCFCCTGCQMVYSILSESNQTLSHTEFKKTELYQKCLETGIIQNPSKESIVRSHIKLKPSNKEKKAVSKGTQNTLTWSFSIENMWCPACAWVIVAMLKETNGVVDAIGFFQHCYNHPGAGRTTH